MTGFLLDIVLVSYGQLDLTSRALGALLVYRPLNSRIILVDNGPPGDDAESLAPAVRASGGIYLNVGPENIGIYACFNRGIMAGGAPVVVLMSNDVVPLPGSLENMFACLSPDVTVVSPTEVNGSFWDYWEATYAAVRARAFCLNETRIARRSFFPCVMIKRAAFLDESVGLFDEAFKLTYGDTDWEERAFALGLPAHLCLSAPVFHGIAVTRKRLGVDREVSMNAADYKHFCAKWAGDPAVLQRHNQPGDYRADVEDNVFSLGER